MTKFWCVYLIVAVSAFTALAIHHSRDRVEIIGEINGQTDAVSMARTNALFEVGLRRMGYAWVEVRGGRNGEPYYVVGHKRGRIPKDYIGNAME